MVCQFFILRGLDMRVPQRLFVLSCIFLELLIQLVRARCEFFISRPSMSITPVAPYSKAVLTTSPSRIWMEGTLTNMIREEYCFLLTPAISAAAYAYGSVSYTHLRAHETKANLVCRLL